MKLKIPTFSSKALLISFLCAIIIVSFTVYLVGFQFHRSVYYNSLVTLSVLATAFFSFLSYGLYFGFKIKPTLRKASEKIGYVNSSHSFTPSALDFDLPEFPDVGDGIEGIVAGIILWICMAVLAVLFLFFFETIVWAGILIAVESIHWILYRAIGLALKRSGSTNGNLLRSIQYAAYYTAIYIGWTYAIVFVFYFLRAKDF
jgi:hypothetical protein